MSRASPDLWEPRSGNAPGRPGPKCKSHMQHIATITEPRVIRSILDSVGHAADSPARVAA